MKILVAQNINGRWQKVAVLAVTKTGRTTFPVRMHGQLSAAAAKAAINQFRAESAAREINLTLVATEFRVSRIDVAA